jgi:hypothetical protein
MFSDEAGAQFFYLPLDVMHEDTDCGGWMAYKTLLSLHSQ